MNSDVKAKFDRYPEQAKTQFLAIRAAIYEVGSIDDVGTITETLKWGEPSYLVKHGSTIRLDWKTQKPQQISMFFNCKTNLLETFREVYGDKLQLLGNREIAIPLSENTPMSELKSCISMALRYHKIKHLPLLGA